MKLPRITPAVRKELRFFAWSIFTGSMGFLAIIAALAAFQGDERFALQVMAIVLLFIVLNLAIHNQPE